MTAAVGIAQSGVNNVSWRNRIINGGMVFDQRNAGASASLTSAQTYFLDRWFAVEDTDGTMTIQQSSTAPAGFSNSALLTTGTADASLGATQLCYFAQKPEGFNVADFAWGTASAQTVTLSFWVRSSLTGTFGGAISNSAFNRSYPFTYTISAANTFEYKTVTITGDTSGTWVTNNGVGMQIFWGLGVGSTYSGTAGAWAGSGFISATGATSVIGTAGATFYITGVQLERGTTATPFEYRDYGRELIMCQRYYYRIAPGASGRMICIAGNSQTSSQSVNFLPFPVTMRTRPSATETTGTASDYAISYAATQTTCSAVPTFTGGTTDITGAVNAYVSSGLTAGQSAGILSNSSTAYLGWSAEL